jgi:mRNA interferase MazF
MSISRGDVWVVDLDPTVGTEIRKSRPAVVVNSDAVGTLPIRLVAPLTEWKDSFSGKIWLVKIEADAANGLSKTSAADTLQLRGVDTSRFQMRLRKLPPDVLDAVAAAIVAVVEFQP